VLSFCAGIAHVGIIYVVSGVGLRHFDFLERPGCQGQLQRKRERRQGAIGRFLLHTFDDLSVDIWFASKPCPTFSKAILSSTVLCHWRDFLRRAGPRGARSSIISPSFTNLANGAIRRCEDVPSRRNSCSGMVLASCKMKERFHVLPLVLQQLSRKVDFMGEWLLPPQIIKPNETVCIEGLLEQSASHMALSAVIYCQCYIVCMFIIVYSLRQIVWLTYRLLLAAVVHALKQRNLSLLGLLLVGTFVVGGKMLVYNISPSNEYGLPLDSFNVQFVPRTST